MGIRITGFYGGCQAKTYTKENLREIVQKDCQACKLNREDVMDRNRWMKQIRDY